MIRQYKLLANDGGFMCEEYNKSRPYELRN